MSQSDKKSTPMLEIGDLHVSYGQVDAVRGVSLSLDAGQIVSVIGPNGAGKTTLLAASMGLLPSKGVLRFEGADLHGLDVESRVERGLCLVPEKRELFGELTVLDNLLLTANVKKQTKIASIAQKWYLRGLEAIPGSDPPTSGRSFPGRLVDFGITPGAYANAGANFSACDPNFNTIQTLAATTPNGTPIKRCRFIYPSTQAADGIKLARLLAQQKALGDLVEVEVPRTVQLYAPVVTKDNVDQFLDTAFES